MFCLAILIHVYSYFMKFPICRHYKTLFIVLKSVLCIRGDAIKCFALQWRCKCIRKVRSGKSAFQVTSYPWYFLPSNNFLFKQNKSKPNSCNARNYKLLQLARWRSLAPVILPTKSLLHEIWFYYVCAGLLQVKGDKVISELLIWGVTKIHSTTQHVWHTKNKLSSFWLFFLWFYTIIFLWNMAGFEID